MLKIQVLGKGMIPRGYGLAPRLDPFSADFTLITTIMSTPGLSVNMIHPENGRVIPLTNQNVKRMYESWANYEPKKNTTPVTSPAAPVPPTVPEKTPEPAKVIAPAQPSNAAQKPATPFVQEKKVETPAPAAVQEPAKSDEKVEAKEEKKDAPSENKTTEPPKVTSFKPINSDDRKNNK